MIIIRKLINLIEAYFVVLIVRTLQGKDSRNYILFGSGFMRFAGNSKYMYLSMLETSGSDWKCVWVSHSESEYRRLSEGNLPVVRYGSFRHLFSGAMARMLVITHNVIDVYPLKPAGAIVLQTWHGTPFKPLGWDSHVERRWIERKRKMGRRLPYAEWDHVLASSRYAVSCFMSGMGLPDSKFMALGQPQNSVWRNPRRGASDDDTLGRWEKNRAGHRFILYAPTFRSSYSPLDGIDWDRVLDFMRKEMSGTILLIRLHPHDELSRHRLSDLMDRYSDILVDVTDEADIMDIMPATDALITDYSSSIFDYLWTGNPILLLITDHDRYVSEVGQLYMDPRTIPTTVVCSDTAELIDAMKSTPEVNREERQRVAKLYNAEYPNPPEWASVITELLKV